jgi:hypothetical protein
MADLSFGSGIPIHLNFSNGFSQVLEKSKNSLNEMTGKTINTITEVTTQATGIVEKTAQTAQQTKISVTEMAGKTVNTVNEATHQMFTSLGQKGEEGKVFLGDRLQGTENLSNSITTKLENAIATVLARQMNTIKLWIDAHPTLSWVTKALVWGINHPILSLVILIFALVILRQFIKAFGSFVEQALLWILKAPFKLVQFLFSLISKPWSKSRLNELETKQLEDNVLALSSSMSASISYAHQERLVKIFTRLEAIRQEQNELLQEVKAILALDELKAE